LLSNAVRPHFQGANSHGHWHRPRDVRGRDAGAPDSRRGGPPRAPGQPGRDRVPHGRGLRVRRPGVPRDGRHDRLLGRRGDRALEARAQGLPAVLGRVPQARGGPDPPVVPPALARHAPEPRAAARAKRDRDRIRGDRGHARRSPGPDGDERRTISRSAREGGASFSAGRRALRPQRSSSWAPGSSARTPREAPWLSARIRSSSTATSPACGRSPRKTVRTSSRPPRRPTTSSASCPSPTS